MSRVGDALELPAGELVSESSAQLCGRRECTFFGVRKILRYAEDGVSLRLCDSKAEIAGKGLRLVVFGNGGALIKGTISGITFTEAEKR